MMVLTGGFTPVLSTVSAKSASTEGTLASALTPTSRSMGSRSSSSSVVIGPEGITVDSVHSAIFWTK